MDVDAALAKLPVKKYREWLAYREAFGPIGEERMDWRFAKMTAILAKAFGGSSLSIEDCLLKFESTSAADILARSVGNMKAWQAKQSARKDRRQRSNK